MRSMNKTTASLGAFESRGDAGISTISVPPVTYAAAGSSLGCVTPMVAHRAPCAIRVDPRGHLGMLETMGETVAVGPSDVSILVPMGFHRGVSVEISLQTPSGAISTVSGRVTRSRRVSTGTFEVGIGIE